MVDLQAHALVAVEAVLHAVRELLEGGEHVLLVALGRLEPEDGAHDLEQPLLVTPGRVTLPLRPGEAVVSISASGYHGAAVTSAGRCFTLGKLVKSGGADLDEPGYGPYDDDAPPADDAEDDMDVAWEMAEEELAYGNHW